MQLRLGIRYKPGGWLYFLSSEPSGLLRRWWLDAEDSPYLVPRDAHAILREEGCVWDMALKNDMRRCAHAHMCIQHVCIHTRIAVAAGGSSTIYAYRGICACLVPANSNINRSTKAVLGDGTGNVLCCDVGGIIYFTQRLLVPNDG